MKLKELLIREITPADARGLLYLANKVLQEEIYSFTSINEFKFGEEEEFIWVKNILENKNNVFLVAEFQNKIIGNISILQNTALKSSHIAELSINIIDQYRDNGIGTTLMDIALKKIKINSDITKIILQVFGNNERAIALYKKFGFIEEGKLKQQIKFSNGLFADVYFMAKWL